MKIKLLLIEPVYQINLGYIARTAKNFGINKLYMVNPKCNPNGNQAIKFSKHARELLENAIIYENIEDALKDSEFVVGTTAIWKKADEAKSNIYTLDDFTTKFKNLKEVTILIGRDNTGLTKREMKMCDASIYIFSRTYLLIFRHYIRGLFHLTFSYQILDLTFLLWLNSVIRLAFCIILFLPYLLME